MEYEYDFAQAFGEHYGLLKRCHSPKAELFNRVHLLEGKISSAAEQFSILSATEQQIALTKWEEGYATARSHYSKCTKDMVPAIERNESRLQKDYGRELQLILEIEGDLPAGSLKP